MRDSPEASTRQIEAWNAVLGEDCHIGGCYYVRGGRTYDLSAANPEKWDMIRDRGLCVIPEPQEG